MNNNNNQNISTQEMQDNLYQAMEIITNSIIKDIPYDRTINCTIINDKDKKNGKYIVTNGSATFTAYSETEQYNVNDKVRVNIPEGNYGKNKYIVGKQASEEELEPINYISPLNDFIQITDNLATTFQGANITANATGTGVQKEKILEIDLTKDYNARNSIRQNIFSTIGVEVGFQTLLKQYDLVDGSYGIELKLTFYDGEKKKTQEEKVSFDSSEFFGYPYNFILPTKQQKAFTISRTDLLKTLEVYLYQDNNFQQIKHGKKEYISPSIMPNIIVTSLSLGFGTNVINIEDNVLELYTLDELEYTDVEGAEENTKRIGFAWYNKDKQNTYLGFIDGIYDSTYDEIDYINKKQISSRLEAEVEKYKKDIPQTTKGIEISADLTDIENAAKSLLSIVDSSLPNLLRRVYRDLNPALSKIFMENPYDADGDNISANSFLERLINNSQQTIGTLAFYYKDNFDKTEKIITYLRNLLKEKATDTIIEQEIQSLEDFLQSLKSLNNYLTLTPDTTLFYLISEGVRNSLYANFGGYFSIYDSYNAQIKEAKDKAYEYIQQIEDILAIGKADDIRTRIQSCSAQDEAYTTSLNEDDYKNRYCVYWYRYNQGYTNPEDTIMGTNWERLSEQDNFGIPTIQGEVIDGIVYNSLRTTDTFSIALDSTKEEERFVAILYYNHQQYKAEPLVFKRKTSDNTVMDLYGSLKINHGKNSKDSYQNYGDDNYLVNSSDTHLERELILSFTSPQGQTLDDFIGGQIYWYVPKNVSMLKYDSRHKILESYAMGDTVNTVPAGHFKEGYYCFTKAISASAENTKKVDVESLKFAYAIDSYYVPTNSNNTIICKIVKGVWTYTAEISFTFSTFGTSGTEYTLMVKPAGLRTAITAKDDLDLIIKLFNYNNEEIPLYYSTPKDAQGLFGTDFELRWSRYEGALSDQTITPACEIKTDSNNKIIGCTLKAGGQDKISCGIMEVYTTVKFNQQELTEEDKGGLKHVRINTYYPVPFSKPIEEGGIDYIEGPTSIVYNTLGNTPRYYDCAFKLFNGATGKEKSIGWRITKDHNGDFPTLDTRNFNHLAPKEIYIKNEKDYPIAYNDNWYQPIIIRQEKYDFDVLNNWDGKLQINKDKDYILSSMMVAGTKDSNNTFTGVMMGDLGKADGSITDSGLFGFQKGINTFGFRTDGTGFIGAGNGKIDFDGTKGIIDMGNVVIRSQPIGSEAYIEVTKDNENVFKVTSQRVIFNDTWSIGNGFLVGESAKEDGEYKTLITAPGKLLIKDKVDANEKLDSYVFLAGGKKDYSKGTITELDEIYKEDWPLRISAQGGLYATKGQIGVEGYTTLYIENLVSNEGKIIDKSYLSNSLNLEVVKNLGTISTSDFYIGQNGILSIGNINYTRMQPSAFYCSKKESKEEAAFGLNGLTFKNSKSKLSFISYYESDGFAFTENEGRYSFSFGIPYVPDGYGYISGPTYKGEGNNKQVRLASEAWVASWALQEVYPKFVSIDSEFTSINNSVTNLIQGLNSRVTYTDFNFHLAEVQQNFTSLSNRISALENK